MFEDVDKTRFRGRPVGIATGGTSRERDISLETGRAFEDALRSKGYDVTVYDVATQLQAIADDRPAAMLLGIHGGLGESGALQGFLESLEIPYTGSGVLASALAMDKGRARAICEASAVPVASGLALSRRDLRDPEAAMRRIIETLGFPVVAKLNDSGSSFGVYICDDRQSLETAMDALCEHIEEGTSSGVIAERFIDGPEYTVGFFDRQLLGVVRIEPAQGFYDFEAKYESNQTEYEMVTDPSICDRLVGWGRQAFETLGCRGVARVDFKGHPNRDGSAVMLEVNTIPGMTATSLVPKMAAHQGLAFEDFVEAMVGAANTDRGARGGAGM